MVDPNNRTGNKKVDSSEGNFFTDSTDETNEDIDFPLYIEDPSLNPVNDERAFNRMLNNTRELEREAPENSILKKVANGISRTLTGFKVSQIKKGLKKTLKRNSGLHPLLRGAIIGCRFVLFPIGSALVAAGRAAGFAAAFSIAIAGGALYLAYGVYRITKKVLIETLKLPIRLINIIIKTAKFLNKFRKNPKQEFDSAVKTVKDSAKSTIKSIKEFDAKRTLKKIRKSKTFQKHINILENILSVSTFGGVAIGGFISGIGMNIVNRSLDIITDQEELNEKIIEGATASAACGAMTGVICISLGSIIYGQQVENKNPDTELQEI